MTALQKDKSNPVTTKHVPSSLVPSANQYLRSPLTVRYKTILLLFYVMEVQILLLLRKKVFMFYLWILIYSSQQCHFFI